MNNKTIIEFGFRIIRRIMEISEGVNYLPRPTASTDNTLLDFHNSSQDTRPHSLIVNSNCPSKLTDKVRRIVHSKLKPFPFQTKTYYLSDGKYQTDSPSHTNNHSIE